MRGKGKALFGVLLGVAPGARQACSYRVKSTEGFKVTFQSHTRPVCPFACDFSVVGRGCEGGS
jgi:hypothetical protein